MPYYCTVPRCTSMAGKAKNVSFHQFPRDEELAKLWNRILKRGKPYTKYSKVCSLHFKPEDYTITSVGKNKGQWRTLRKDAVPSQNLPSDSPVPYTPRKTSSYWAPSPNVVDPTIQQQVAQAIYMQTMLAIQAASSSESTPNDQPTQPETSDPSPSSSSELELLLRCKPEQKDETYQCQECSKCFKDPDVFLLHKRIHSKNVLEKLPLEKENFSGNIQQQDTLRSNPILANLLKTSMRLEPDNPNIFEANVLSVENQIMTALASNMEAYIKTLTSMLASQKATENASEQKSDSDSGDENSGDGEKPGEVDKCEFNGDETGDVDKCEVDGDETGVVDKCEVDCDRDSTGDESNNEMCEKYQEKHDLSIDEDNQGENCHEKDDLRLGKENHVENDEEKSHCDSIVDKLALNCD